MKHLIRNFTGLLSNLVYAKMVTVSAVMLMVILLAAPLGAYESGLPFGVEASPYGINFHSPYSDGVAWEPLIAECKAIGIDWLRIDMHWVYVEAQQGVFDWSVYDKAIDEVYAQGFNMFASITSVPDWAHSSSSKYIGVPNNPQDFYDFCKMVAKRYRGKITYWGLWNEPNLGQHSWDGTRQQFIDIILINGAAGLRAGNPDAKVGGPEIACQDMTWSIWLKDCIEQAGDSLDFLTIHTYAKSAKHFTERMEKPTRYGKNPEMWTKTAPAYHDHEPSVKEVLEYTGVLGKIPLWIPEVGWSSGESPEYYECGEALQAINHRGLLTDWFSGKPGRTWLAKVFFYELKSPTSIKDSWNFPPGRHANKVGPPREAYRWGILGPYPEYRRKEAFYAYQRFILEQKLLKSKAYDKNGQLDKAVELYEDMVSVGESGLPKRWAPDVDGGHPYVRLAAIYQQRGRTEEEKRLLEKAVWIFENIVSLESQDRTAHLNRFKLRLHELQGQNAVAADLDSPYGIILGSPHAEGMEVNRLLDECQIVGLGWVRIDMQWSKCEPQKGRFDWQAYDQLVQAAEIRGLHLLASITSTPAWATGGTAEKGVPDNAEDFTNFCQQAAKRYRGKIGHWGLWSQANLGEKFGSPTWEGTRQQYIDVILKPGADALHAGNPDAKVAGPDLVMIGNPMETNPDWCHWLKDCLDQAGDKFDIITQQVYSLSGVWVALRLKHESRNRENPDLWYSDHSSAPSLKDVLQATGFMGKKPVWVTATGWTSNEGGEVYEVGEDMQSENIEGTLYELLTGSTKQEWVNKIFFRELRSENRFEELYGQTFEKDRFGILGPYPDYARKKAFYAYRDFIQEDRLKKAFSAEVFARFDEAIYLYEQVLASNYFSPTKKDSAAPGADTPLVMEPYERLAAIYRNQNRCDDEVRSLERGVWVYEHIVSSERKDRLATQQQLRNGLLDARKRMPHPSLNLVEKIYKTRTP